ncbi:MAG TPA: hypothetical protein VH370_08185 [Humisphaera sp.]|jgi:ABC-2 type transport system permease protein|nr:hypothetical protein [Humisphaera sp.]
MPIFDQGYQHWNGQLANQTWRWLVITRQGLRAGMKNIIVRIVLLLAWIPAIALAAFLCIWGLLERQSDLLSGIMPILRLLGSSIVADPKHYRLEVWTISFHFFLSVEVYFSMILILLMGPNLISQDLRFNALPLYLSRPLRRIDYFVGKLAIIAALLGMVMVLPAIIAYLLGLLLSLDITILRDTFRLVVASIAYGSVFAMSGGLLVLALSSLSRNSRYVALFWLGVWFLGGVLGQALDANARDQRRHIYFANIDRASMRRVPAARSRGERNRFEREMSDAYRRADEEFQAAEVRASATNWRPLVSYTANITRVGEQMLGTNNSWDALSKLWPAGQRQTLLLFWKGQQYPWYWSAGVLLGLFGLSTWILNVKVKSLDRLK